MLDYSKWKLVNESLGSMTLGFGKKKEFVAPEEDSEEVEEKGGKEWEGVPIEIGDDDDEKEEKKPKKKVKKAKKSKKEKELEESKKNEDILWWKSVKSQLSFDPAAKFESGVKNEDLLITPEDKKEPGPGEPGYAPVGKIGDNSMESYVAWEKKYFPKK